MYWLGSDNASWSFHVIKLMFIKRKYLLYVIFYSLFLFCYSGFGTTIRRPTAKLIAILPPIVPVIMWILVRRSWRFVIDLFLTKSILSTTLYNGLVNNTAHRQLLIFYSNLYAFIRNTYKYNNGYAYYEVIFIGIKLCFREHRQNQSLLDGESAVYLLMPQLTIIVDSKD